MGKNSSFFLTGFILFALLLKERHCEAETAHSLVTETKRKFTSVFPLVYIKVFFFFSNFIVIIW